METGQSQGGAVAPPQTTCDRESEEKVMMIQTVGESTDVTNVEENLDDELREFQRNEKITEEAETLDAPSVVPDPQLVSEEKEASGENTKPDHCEDEDTLTEDKLTRSTVTNEEQIELGRRSREVSCKDIDTIVEEEELEEAELEEAELEGDLETDGKKRHTWQPKVIPEIVPTPIEREEVVPIHIDDVPEPGPLEAPAAIPKVAEAPARKEAPAEAPPAQEPPETISVPQLLPNGELGSPIEIPEGIPLLARVLPLDDDAHKERIPLERLFTPATDSSELIITKKKKQFASSDFYAPDHPTIDDQLELAQKISFSLGDHDNKLSKGQAMYERRKLKSDKWVHQEGAQEYYEESSTSEQIITNGQPEPKHTKEPLKLILNPKGVHDHKSVEAHYQELQQETQAQARRPPHSPEVVREIIGDMQSPTGKGAALFAKRKKRMDKFIIDETNVQKTSAYIQSQQNSVISSSEMSTTSSTQQFSSSGSLPAAAPAPAPAPAGPLPCSIGTSKKKQSAQERDAEQKRVMEEFIKNRDAPLKLVKSPWEAALEDGSPSLAFQDNRKPRAMTAPGPVPQNTPLLDPPMPVPVQPTLQANLPPLSLPSLPEEGSPGLMYTAEVMLLPAAPITPELGSPCAAPAPHPLAAAPAPALVQAPAPAPAPAHSLRASAEADLRRSSGNFNLAASGFGTYNKFYRPISFMASN